MSGNIKIFLYTVLTTLLVFLFVFCMVKIYTTCQSVVNNKQTSFYLQKSQSKDKYYLHYEDNVYLVSFPKVNDFLKNAKNQLAKLQFIFPPSVNIFYYITKSLTKIIH